MMICVSISCNVETVKQKDITIDSLRAANKNLQSIIDNYSYTVKDLKEELNKSKANEAKEVLYQQSSTKFAYVVINFTRSYPPSAGGEIVNFNYCTPIQEIEDYSNDKKYRLVDNQLNFFKRNNSMDKVYDFRYDKINKADCFVFDNYAEASISLKLVQNKVDLSY